MEQNKPKPKPRTSCYKTLMQKTEKLKRVYDKIPKMNCQRKCQEACGPIAMSQLEYKILCQRSGKKKLVTDDSMTCPLLNNGACTAYHDRPLICRLWGVVDNPKMKCPHGCVPERWLSDQEAGRLMDEVRKISGGELQIVTPEGMLDAVPPTNP